MKSTGGIFFFQKTLAIRNNNSGKIIQQEIIYRLIHATKSDCPQTSRDRTGMELERKGTSPKYE